jgi:RNA polymerase sigma-70 factor (ECF subfamily)
VTEHAGRQPDVGADVEAVAEAVAERGDRFAQALDRNQGSLLRYVGRMLGRRDAGAEDIVQECFLRLHRAWREADGPADARVRAWLFTAAHNLTMDAIRKRTRRRLWRTQPPDPRSLPEGTAGRDDPADEFDALERITRSEAAAAALAALDCLPDEQQHVVLMKVIEGLTFRQIAKAVGISLGSVNGRLTRGLATLAEQLKRTGHI